jgi:hypothetical protein
LAEYDKDDLTTRSVACLKFFPESFVRRFSIEGAVVSQENVEALPIGRIFFKIDVILAG